VGGLSVDTDGKKPASLGVYAGVTASNLALEQPRDWYRPDVQLRQAVPRGGDAQGAEHVCAGQRHNRRAGRNVRIPPGAAAFLDFDWWASFE
jgi:hypothetical protein